LQRFEQNNILGMRRK